MQSFRQYLQETQTILDGYSEVIDYFTKLLGEKPNLNNIDVTRDGTVVYYDLMEFTEKNMAKTGYPDYVPLKLRLAKTISIHNDKLTDYSFLFNSKFILFMLKTDLSGEEFFKPRKIDMLNVELYMGNSASTDPFSLKGIDKCLTTERLVICSRWLPTNLLGLINIPNIKEVIFNIYNNGNSQEQAKIVKKIVNDHIGKDILDFKEALINAGFKDHAKF